MKKSENELQSSHEKVDRDFARYSLDKTIALTAYCSVAYLAFGVLSLKTIRTFQPSIELWDNIWPRFLFVSLPFACLYLFLRKSRKSDDFKLSLWCFSFSVINAISACVNVWPIAYAKPEIILYFNSVNSKRHAIVG